VLLVSRRSVERLVRRTTSSSAAPVVDRRSAQETDLIVVKEDVLETSRATCHPDRRRRRAAMFCARNSRDAETRSLRVATVQNPARWIGDAEAAAIGGRQADCVWAERAPRVGGMFERQPPRTQGVARSARRWPRSPSAIRAPEPHWSRFRKRTALGWGRLG